MPTPEQYKLIDTLFPVAGQDNESQGFRDNFSATYDSLEYCETEIANLQEYTVKLNVENTFTEDSAIKEAKLVACSEEVFDLGSSPTIRNQDIDYNFGGYQAFKLGSPENNVAYQFTITGWPNVDGLAANKGKYARIRVQLTSDNNVSRTPTFVTTNNNPIKYDKSWPATLTVSSETHPTVVEFWSYDGGDTVYAKYVGQFGAGVGVTTADDLVVNGNATLGNAPTDTIAFGGIPKLPVLSSDPLTGEAGMLIFNSTSKQVKVFDGTGWVALN